jgi:hypothetical protein
MTTASKERLGSRRSPATAAGGEQAVVGGGIQLENRLQMRVVVADGDTLSLCGSAIEYGR